MADVVVVGSGIAGLFVANRCARAGLSTLVVTKKNLSDSSTNWAQGGIAAAMSNDDLEAHIRDTIEAGCGLSQPEIVNMVILESSDRIADLVSSGVQFDSDEDGFDLTIEGGHSSAVVQRLNESLCPLNRGGLRHLQCLISSISEPWFLSSVWC